MKPIIAEPKTSCVAMGEPSVIMLQEMLPAAKITKTINKLLLMVPRIDIVLVSVFVFANAFNALLLLNAGFDVFMRGLKFYCKFFNTEFLATVA